MWKFDSVLIPVYHKGKEMGRVLDFCEISVNINFQMWWLMDFLTNAIVDD